MTRALVTQLANALERMDGWLKVRHLCGLMPDEIALVKAAREYLATEQLSKAFDAAVEVVGEHRVAKSLALPSGERAELIRELRERHNKRLVISPSMFSKAADMLEADAQQAKHIDWSAA